MRKLDVSAITEAVAKTYVHINMNIRPDVLAAIRRAVEVEESPTGRAVLEQYLENNRIAAETGIPCCQDTGVATVFVHLGQDVELTGGLLTDAIDQGVRQAQQGGPLRASMVAHPLDRRNTGDNTPAIVHVELTAGEALTLDVLAKGGGAENTSRVCMLSPGDGRDGVLRAVVETVDRARANACPPVVVGVGLGGSMEMAALLAKRALCRPLDVRSSDPICAGLEVELLEKINDLGIGPQGLGGRVTALGVLVDAMPCHIASLPVAVNLMCHSFRHQRVEI